MIEKLEDGEIVLCTVDRIDGAMVFVKIDNADSGSITFSEIAPGRIRNIRDYVVPKKRIVCKILRISNNHVELSLRRVSQKEKKEKLEEAKQEKSYLGMLKSVLKEKTDEIVKKIQKETRVYDLLEEAKENPKKLEKFITKSDVKKIVAILNSQKTKKKILKKNISIISRKSDGITSIKNLLKGLKEIKIHYITAGKYVLEAEAEDIKKADNKLKEIISDLEKKSKKQGIEFSILEK